jgi:putative alpha-1,2-mannosidase
MESRDAAVLLRLDPLTAGQQILIRMGLSFISPDQACSNAITEIPTFDFPLVSTSSVSQFNSLLNRLRVDTTSIPDDTLILFYSSVLLPLPPSTGANLVIPHVIVTAELHGRESIMEIGGTDL